jgi:hypothetical protein
MAKRYINPSPKSTINPVTAALALAARGIPVCPLDAKTKRPASPHGVKDASCDPARLREWFSRPALVPAIACGEPSGISVLDIDRQHGGGEWWQTNRKLLPATFAYRTKSGGIHLWFRHRQELRTVPLGVIGAGAEIRSNGGCAIYWPATGLPVLCAAEAAPWPQWLLPPPRPAPEPRCEFADGRPPERVEAVLAGLVRVAALARAGERNQRLHWAACRAAEMAMRGEIGRSTAEAVLIEAAACAGLPCPEAKATLASAFRGAR